MKSQRLIIQMQKNKVLSKKINIKKYLSVLSGLCSPPIVAEDLLSLEESDDMRTHLREMVYPFCSSFRLAFAAKESPQFIDYIGRLEAAKSGVKYLWIKLANDCGYAKLHSLGNFNTGFAYDVDPNGLIVLYSADCAECLSFDFFEDDGGDFYMDVSVKGDIWPKVIY
jgi:hypothetical protein